MVEIALKTRYRRTKGEGTTNEPKQRLKLQQQFSSDRSLPRSSAHNRTMEMGTKVAASSGGTLGKLYAFTPHYKVDQMQATHGQRFNLEYYKKAMTAGAVLFLLSMISLASCYYFIIFVGITHIFACVLPYFQQILWPTIYFIYTIVIALFIFISFCGAFAKCWGFSVFIFLPSMVLSGYLCYVLAKTDPVLMNHLLRKNATQTTEVTPQAGSTAVVVGTAVPTPMAGPGGASHV